MAGGIARGPARDGYNASERVMMQVTVKHPIGIDELRQLAKGRFGDMVKGVVDLRRSVILLDADMHADQEAELLAEGSARADLWGIICTPMPGMQIGSSSTR